MLILVFIKTPKKPENPPKYLNYYLYLYDFICSLINLLYENSLFKVSLKFSLNFLTPSFKKKKIIVF